MTTAPPINSAWILGRRFLPLGLAYVAGALEKANFPVELLDNYLLKKPIDGIKHEINRLSPEIVGITCGSGTYQRCVETAKAVKEVIPSCKVVVGGWHPSYMPESMLQHPEIDYAVIGEGERTMINLAGHIIRGEDDSALSEIPGIAYRHGTKIKKTSPKFIEDLDEVPFPARHLLPMHLYARKMEFLNVTPVDTMNIIRGCPYNCAFCETKRLWGSKCRNFSASRVIDEINHLADKHGSKGIYFIGDNFTINKQRTIELCKMIKSELDIEWACDTRVDLISRDLLKEMKDAGCRTIWFGVESGSPRILTKINKNIRPDQVVQAFRLCRKEGIQIACSLMLGIPGETINDMKATFNFAKKLDPDWCQFNIFVSYPGSSLYDEIIQNDLFDRVEDFVYYVKTDEFDYELVLKLQKQFHKGFNRTPKRILRKIRQEGFLTVLRRNLKL